MNELLTVLDWVVFIVLIVYGGVFLLWLIAKNYKIEKSTHGLSDQELIKVYERDFAHHDDGHRIFLKVTGWSHEKLNNLIRTYGSEFRD